MGLSTYAGKRVLVTGDTGFKGAWLVFWLLKLGAKVAGYSDRIPTKPSLFETLKLNSHIQDHRADIRDYQNLKRVFDEFKPECVFHLAAQSLVRVSYDSPKETFDVNVGGTVNVLEAVRHSANCKFGVIVTTDKTYENSEQDVPFKESDRLGGRDPYSASKAGAEIIFHSYVKSFFAEGRARLSSARAGNVIGGGDWAEDRIVPDCMRSWAENKEVILRNPRSSRPWQHVLDPLYGYLRLGEELENGNSKVVGQSFNFGPLHGESVSVEKLVEELAKNWGMKQEGHQVAGQWKTAPESVATKHEAKTLRLNCEKAASVLKWSQRLLLPEMARMTASWYADFYRGGANMTDVTLAQINEFEKILK